MIKIHNLPYGLSLKTPGKVNLLLKVGEKRKDGFHEILTIFQGVDLWDEIVLEEDEKIEIVSYHPQVPSGKDNIIYRAAKLLQDITRIKKGVRITLHKTIPIAGGMGGGSSDAAATIIGLNKLWGLHYDKEALMDIGKKIGSDVPFFMDGPSALGFGRGEKLMPLIWPKVVWLLLINPGIPISTSWAYEELSRHRKMKRDHNMIGEGIWLGPFIPLNFELTKLEGNIKIPLLSYIKIDSQNQIWVRLFNDFEEVITRRYPIIRECKEIMVAFGSEGTLMSGSGATVFGIFYDKSGAEKAFRAAEERGFKAWIVKTLRDDQTI